MWDERYSADDYVYGEQPNDFLREHVGRLPGGRVLCLAEGEGRNAVFLAERGDLQVVGVDSSAVGLQKAQRLADTRGVSIETVHADLAQHQMGIGQNSAVVSIFCHLPPALRAEVYPRAVESLAPGGVLLLEAYSKDQLGRGTGGPPVADLLYALDELRTLLAGLELERAVELERDVVEGRFHSGHAAVVQIIGVKRQ